MARRGGKRKAKTNPHYEIPSDWSKDMWQWAPKETYAHWTSYPIYAYQQFYRANPRPPEWKPGPDIVKCADCGVLVPKSTMWGSVCLTCYNLALPELPVSEHTRGKPAKKSWWARNNGEVDVPRSSWESKAVPWTYAQNAGPFLPQMFPYGQGGRPYVYSNPKSDESGCPRCSGLGEPTGRTKTSGSAGACHYGPYTKEHCLECGGVGGATGLGGMSGYEGPCHYGPYVADEPENQSRSNGNRFGSGRRGGFSAGERSSLPNWYFLKPSGRGWPAGDPRRGARDDMHALEVIRYMNRGFGNRAEYPTLIRELARRYSPEDDENRGIWTSYQRSLEGILRKSPRMPSMAELRRLG